MPKITFGVISSIKVSSVITITTENLAGIKQMMILI